MIAVRPFSIHPNRSTEVKVRMIIDNFRIDLCPFNIMAVIRNRKINSVKFQKVMLQEIGDANLKSRRGNKSAFL